MTTTSAARAESPRMNADAKSSARSPITGDRARTATIIRWTSIALIGISCMVIIRSLPFDQAIDRLQSTVSDLGVWGPIVIGLAYVVAALLFVPGSALTLASGALFGPLWGTVTVSVSSTTAAALAFLIARYLARAKVAAQAARFPTFAAMDEAIGQGGPKIVAMLRLSPAVPFSLSNYLYGLTSIRFSSYVLASWMFMLPGTFMYAYLGHVGQVGVSAAAGAQAKKSPGEWALLVVGLLATIAVTLYVTRLARTAIRQRTRIQDTTASKAVTEATMHTKHHAPRRRFSAYLLPLLAVVSLAGATYACTHRSALRGLFGPPNTTLQEAYAQNSDSASFDHGAFDMLLKTHVDRHGWIDYAALSKESKKLNEYLLTIERVQFDRLGRDEKLALLINAYNAFTLRLILDHYPLNSIKDIPDAQRWDAKRWNVGGHNWSLNQMEHEQIRPKFVEPRVHFALVCAAVGCPKLRNEAYQADRLEEQLESQTRYVHSNERWFRFDSAENVVHLTRLYDWYGGDFKQVAGSVIQFAARYSAPLKAALDNGTNPRIKWLDYDWTLNDGKNKD